MATKQQNTTTNELPASETITRKCRVSEDDPQVECAITINWDDAKAERTFATRGVIIAAQAMMRASGAIPSDLTVSVSELAKRERGGFAMKPTATNAKRLMVKMSDDEYAVALASIGVNAGEVKRLVAARKSNAAMQAPVGVEAKRAAKRPGPVTTTK